MKTIPVHPVLGSIAVSVMTLALATTVAVAQTVPDSGQRVRVTQASGKRITGVLHLMTRQDLTVRDTAGHRDHVISRTGIILFERSTGRRRNFWGNFAATFVVATIGVGAISAVTWSPCTSTELFGCFLFPESRADAFAFGALGGALIGVPAGVIVGARRYTEHWLPVASGEVGSDVRLSAFVGAGPARSARVGIQLPVAPHRRETRR